MSTCVGVLQERLVRIAKPLFVVPNLSIHFQTQAEREVLKLNKEKHVRPIVATEVVHKLNSNESAPILEYIAKHLNVAVGDIVDMDLFLMDVQQSSLSGLYEEFLSSGRMDNLASCFSIMGGFLDFVNSNESKDSEYISCSMYFNYEEIGSRMSGGGDSDITMQWLEKLYGSFNTSPVENKDRMLVVNVDMSHAVHPNYPERHSDSHTPRFHEGVVVKRNVNGRYANDIRATGVLLEVARACDVPTQSFRVANDSPCGSTIGPFLSSRLCVPVIDVGMTQLAMHSAREVCSIVDLWYMKVLVKALYANRAVFNHYTEG